MRVEMNRRRTDERMVGPTQLNSTQLIGRGNDTVQKKMIILSDDELNDDDV